MGGENEAGSPANDANKQPESFRPLPGIHVFRSPVQALREYRDKMFPSPSGDSRLSEERAIAMMSTTQNGFRPLPEGVRQVN